MNTGSAALKRGGGSPAISREALKEEAPDALEPWDSRTPEAAFDRNWASQQLDRAVKRLRDDYDEAGKAPVNSWSTWDPSPNSPDLIWLLRHATSRK